MAKAILCPHGILGKSKCRECHNEYRRNARKKNPERARAIERRYRERNRLAYIKQKRETHRKWREKNQTKRYQEKQREYRRRWRMRHPEKVKVHNLITHHPEQYPLDSECAFCGATDKLEHGHIDYTFPEIYLTVCHPCNSWMDIKD